MNKLTIISGGQTGADRAALDWAIAHDVPHGGWCPKRHRAEDGPLSAQYRLDETPTANYLQRTEWNIRDSDATVIFSIAPKLTGGSLKTAALAKKHGKPLLHLSAIAPDPHAKALREFMTANRIRRLNVAGPRASKEPEIAAFVRTIMDQTFEAIAANPIRTRKQHEE